MRRYFTILMVAVVAVALLVSACGDKNDDKASAPPPPDMSAQEIFEKTMAASAEMTSATATMEMEVETQMASDASPDPATAMLSQGAITMDGDLAASTEPAAGEGQIKLSLGGQSMEFGFKMVDDKAYLNYLGTWYETPPEAMEQIQKQQQQSADPLAMLSELGVDPAAWASSMSVVGTEEVAGVETYHVQVDVDTAKMLTDLLTLMESPEVSDALGSAAGDLSTPSAEELAQVEQVFKSAKLDLWSQTDTFFPRKMAVSLEIVPPPDEAAGLESMTISMELVYDSVNEPVTVEAPTDAKPWKELEPALEGLGSMLGGTI